MVGVLMIGVHFVGVGSKAMTVFAARNVFVFALFIATSPLKAEVSVTVGDIGGDFFLEVSYSDGAVQQIQVNMLDVGSQRTILVGPHGEALPIEAARLIVSRYGDKNGVISAAQIEAYLLQKAEEYSVLSTKLANA